MEEKSYPNPGIAAVLSFLFSGLGQVYNGDITKGLILMSISCISILVLIIGGVITANAILGRVTGWGGNPLIGCMLLVISIFVISVTGVYNIYNAYDTAKKRQQ